MRQFCVQRLNFTFNPYFQGCIQGGGVSGINHSMEFLILMWQFCVQQFQKKILARFAGRLFLCLSLLCFYYFNCIQSIWSVDSKENNTNCCHQMSYLMLKCIFRLGLCPRPCWGSSHHSPRHSSCIWKVLLLTQGKRQEGEKRDGREGKSKGKERKRGKKGERPEREKKVILRAKFLAMA